MNAVTAAELDALDGKRLGHALRAGIRRLLQRQEHLNKINVFPVPDGDTGTNMALTLSAVLNVLRSREHGHAGQMLTRVADAALDGARGNSGAILAQFFLGLCDRVGHLNQLTVHDFADGVQGGAIYARESLAEPREGTILTVLTDFAAEVRTQVARHNVRDFRALFDRALARARTSVEATRLQLESLRRANVVDAGALGFVEMLEGMSEYIETGQVVEDDVEPVVAHEDESAAGQEENLEHRYCTECVVVGLQIDRRHLREELATIGSSLVVAGTHAKARVHVHVNEPEAVFRVAAKYGAVSGQKADDMQRQQEAAHHRRDRLVAVVTDSAADLPEEAMDRLDIHMIPVRVHFGEHSYLDKVSMSPEQFYAELASNPQHPKTSQPPPGDFRRAFEFLASHYESVVYVGLTSQASGTLQSGQSAAQRSTAGRRISTVDSYNASLGQGLIVMHAAELARAGLGAEEVVRGALDARRRTRTFALLSTTDYAVRGGRVPAWAGRIASLLRVSPLLATFPDGRISIGGALLGHRDLRSRFARFVSRRMTGAQRWHLAVAHANAPAEAEQLLAELIAGRSDIESSFIIPLGTALGAHGGPGALVVAFQEALPVPARPAAT